MLLGNDGLEKWRALKTMKLRFAHRNSLLLSLAMLISFNLFSQDVELMRSTEFVLRNANGVVQFPPGTEPKTYTNRLPFDRSIFEGFSDFSPDYFRLREEQSFGSLEFIEFRYGDRIFYSLIIHEANDKNSGTRSLKAYTLSSVMYMPLLARLLYPEELHSPDKVEFEFLTRFDYSGRFDNLAKQQLLEEITRTIKRIERVSFRQSPGIFYFALLNEHNQSARFLLPTEEYIDRKNEPRDFEFKYFEVDFNSFKRLFVFSFPTQELTNFKSSDGTVFASYSGHVLDQVPYGIGKAVLANGGKYTGMFKEGLFHGLGVLRDSEGRMLFRGFFRENMYFSGTESISNGDLFSGNYDESGEWRSGRYFIRKYDAYFEGQFKNNEFDRGSFIFSNGVKLNGRFKGMKVLEGVTYSFVIQQDNRLIYKGGIIETPNPQIREMLFIPHGSGVLVTSAGKEVEGNWENGMLNGKSWVDWFSGE